MHGLSEPGKFAEWRSLYWNHRKMERAIIKHLMEENGLLGGDTEFSKPETWQLMFQALRNVKEARGLQHILDFLCRFTSPVAVALGQWGETLAVRSTLEPDDDVESARLARMMEARFIAMVWLPCRVEFRRFPSEIYFDAAHGDFKSLCHLLRVDKSMIMDGRINRRFARIRLDGGGRWRKLSAAYSGRLRKRNKRNIKMMVAAFLHDLGRESAAGAKRLEARFPGLDLNMPSLTAPDIRAIFDAQAQKADGTLQDSDLPPGDEALYAGLRENSGRFMDTS